MKHTIQLIFQWLILCILATNALLGVALDKQMEQIGKSLVEGSLQTLLQQRVALLEQHDPLSIIPRMRDAFNKLKSLKSSTSASAEQITSLERELGILTQQYIKELDTATIESLKALAKQIQDLKSTLRSLGIPLLADASAGQNELFSLILI